MTFAEFQASLKLAEPPVQLNPLLKSLWYDGKGDWESSHNIAQDIHTNDGSWIHAYLHRKEGDIGNATYWYNRAGKPVARVSLNEEWEQLVNDFLNR